MERQSTLGFRKANGGNVATSSTRRKPDGASSTTHSGTGSWLFGFQIWSVILYQSGKTVIKVAHWPNTQFQIATVGIILKIAGQIRGGLLANKKLAFFAWTNHRQVNLPKTPLSKIDYLEPILGRGSCPNQFYASVPPQEPPTFAQPSHVRIFCEFSFARTSHVSGFRENRRYNLSGRIFWIRRKDLAKGLRKEATNEDEKQLCWVIHR